MQLKNKDPSAEQGIEIKNKSRFIWNYIVIKGGNKEIKAKTR